VMAFEFLQEFVEVALFGRHRSTFKWGISVNRHLSRLDSRGRHPVPRGVAV